MKTLVTGALIASLLYLPCLAQQNEPQPEDKSSVLIGVCLGVIVIVSGVAIVICVKKMADRIPTPQVPPPPDQPPPKKKNPPPPTKRKAQLAATLDWYDISSLNYVDVNGSSPSVYTSFGVASLEWSSKPDSGWQKQYSLLAWLSPEGMFLSFQSNGVPVINSYHSTIGSGWETNYIDLPMSSEPNGFYRITPGL